MVTEQFTDLCVLIVSLDGDMDATLFDTYADALEGLRTRAQLWEELDNPRPELDRSTATLEQLDFLWKDGQEEEERTWCAIIPCSRVPVWMRT